MQSPQILGQTTEVDRQQILKKKKIKLLAFSLDKGTAFIVTENIH